MQIKLKLVSMAGSPITLVKASLKFVVETLKPEDQFSIVSFGATAKVDLPLSKMTTDGLIIILYSF